MKKPKKERIPIPKETERKLLVECGHQCSNPVCYEKQNLEIHHINGDRSDNRESNLIVFCPNHHAMADRGEIERKECESYKERLKQIVNLRPKTETLKEKVEREGIDVIPENAFVSLILSLGRRYMNWRYGKPDVSINREIIVLFVPTLLCFVPLFYITLVLKTQVTIGWIYVSLIFAIIGAVLMMIFAVIYHRRCSKCKGYFGIERIDSKKVDEKIYETETETRIEKISRNTYRCIFCGYTYSLNESEYERIPKN